MSHMKLRNKKTGEIGRIEIFDTETICVLATEKPYVYHSLAELNEDWEDYVEPKEPLIKDEKIRKAVRAWADANKVSSVYCWRAYEKFNFEDIGKEQTNVEFVCDKPLFETIKDSYTITELCGEEE